MGARDVVGRDEAGMSVLDRKPWLDEYPAGLPAEITREFPSALAMFGAAVVRAPEQALIHYFDTTLTVDDVDRASDALACALQELGVARGDRVGLYLQNVPQFVIGMVAIWKLGAITVSINPMNRERELAVLLADSGTTALICLEDLYRDVVSRLDAPDLQVVVTTSELAFAADQGHPMFDGVVRQRHSGTHDFLDLVRRYEGCRPPAIELSADDVAFLTYTSGTTGPPKGAMNTHGNVVFNAQTYRDWVGLGSDDVVLGIAPLFHITGLVAHVAVCLLVPMPLVLAFRFDAPLMLELIERYGATFTTGSITAFLALMNDPSAAGRDVSSLTKVYSGGQPVPAATVATFEERFGPYIHIAYGLTETTSPSHLVPFGTRAPIDPTNGSISVGVPVFNTVACAFDDRGNELPPGEVGEIVIGGPQVIPGYWEKPEESAAALPDGMLRTGDVGYVSPEGWFFVVDRKKDLINASGYKVWPREVEDVLYEHALVREAAVIGIPDAYRGETVKAYVSLIDGASVTPDELVEFCRQRLAAYKYPRDVEIIDEIPKNLSGKTLRRALRDRVSSAEAVG
jgi:long-chain acyl-CoA synthetase